MMFLLRNTEYECLALEHWQHILWVLCVIKWGCHLSDLLHHILQILHWVGAVGFGGQAGCCVLLTAPE